MRTRKHLSLLTLLCTAVVAAACASTGTGARADRSVLTAEELDELGPGITAYEAIERLRPVWLRDRGVYSPNMVDAAGEMLVPDDNLPRVHIDRTPVPLETLRSMRANEIGTIRFLSGPDASTLYGTGYATGLIEVVTRGAVARPPGG